MKEKLLGKTPEELREIASSLELPPFAGQQIASWIYRKRVTRIDQMSNLSLRNRTLLSERYEIGLSAPIRETTSSDGTKKYLFSTEHGKFIESAFIPDGDRATLCLSSQAGCRMGCSFCMTARQGFQHNLSTAEILNQIISLPECDRLTNVVYMGMGEPLDNPDAVLRSIEVLTAEWGFGWSPTRITLSTIGAIPGLKRFLEESRAHLAISLHNAIPEERQQLMPAEKAWPIEEVIQVLRSYDFTHQRRVSFEYIVFKGLNDTPAHIRALSRLLAGMPCRINLIRFHAIPGSPYVSPAKSEMEAFRDALIRKGFIATIRASRGEDIEAACGLLSTKRLLEKSPNA